MPDVTTFDALVVAQPVRRRGGSVAGRFMSKAPDDGVSGDALAAASSAPTVDVHGRIDSPSVMC